LNILNKELLDDCLGGSAYYRLTLDSPLTAELIKSFPPEGELEYHPDFAHPYFQFKGNQRFIIKGLEGERICKLIIPSDSSNSLYHEVQQLFKRIG
jgi:hypothetical protein